MKILVLTDEMFRAGGLARSLSHKLHHWQGVGHTVELVTIEGEDRPDFYQLPDGIRRHDLGIRYDRESSLHSPQNLIAAARHFMRLRAILRHSKADIVIHCGYGFDFYFVPVLRSRHAFLVKENHSSRYFAGRASFALRVKQYLRRFFDERYDACVFLSKEEARLAQVRNAVVIPNPMPELNVSARDKRNVVIAVGRICTFKGFDRLLRSWALVESQVPEWQLEIYGDGDEQDVALLRELITTLGIINRATIFPATSNIFERISESRLLVMSSRTECFPMVLLEAMQLGVPVIAFDCHTGPRNILVHQHTGLLIEDGDLEALAAAMQELIRSDELMEKISDNARTAVKRYRMSEVAKLWEELFIKAQRL